MWVWFGVVAFLVRFFSSLVVLLVRFEIDHGVQLFRSIPVTKFNLKKKKKI